MRTDRHDHFLHDAARMLRQAARQLDTLADNIKADVSPEGSTRHAVSMILANMNGAEARIKSLE